MKPLTETSAERLDRTLCLWQRIGAMALLCVLAGAVCAGPIDNDVHVKPEFYFTGITNYYSDGGASANYDTVAATGELTFYSKSRPYWGGPFVDYRYSSHDRFDKNFNYGVYFRYNFPRVDATTWLFINQSPGNADTWVYAMRIRYRVMDDHKLGMEALAPVRTADEPKLMVGYYGSVSESLSLNVLAGGHAGGSPDFAAKVELVWQVR